MFSAQKKYVHLWRGYDSDLLSFKDFVDEFNEKLGFVGVQQLIIAGPSDKYYEIEDDVEIRQLFCLVSDKFSVINIYAVEECELAVTLPNIVHHTKTYAAVASAVSDGCSSESEEESDDGINPDDFDYNSEKIEVTEHFIEYKHCGMSFKDIAEARKFMNLHALVCKEELVFLKSDNIRLRCRCEEGCPFICLISMDKGREGCRVKTLNTQHECNDKFNNNRVDYLTIAHYFKRKLQDDDGYEVLEGKDKYIIKLERRRCTYRMWDIFGIPCPRAIRALLYLKKDPLNEIHWWYTKEAYLLTYHHKIQPVPDEKFWTVDLAMDPPDMMTLVGRPRV
ncbi:hypothetical protein RND71_038483 [Anisodus tanguticus]|uniref:Zinc finger PMZ-type domain-containing protein n=1 Tax=Anisodus tanguticus TaxID=243964 RepID=A0AAE1UTJ5_9SOLA|nr:hypothetical protein RND71_038483 [Anisodus tanguticus]